MIADTTPRFRGIHPRSGNRLPATAHALDHGGRPGNWTARIPGGTAIVQLFRAAGPLPKTRIEAQDPLGHRIVADCAMGGG